MGGGGLRASATAYLALGSNLGNRLGALRTAALRFESTAGVRVLGRSAVYRTEPVGPPEQPDYANQVLAVATELSPAQLLELAMAIEHGAGRRREQRYGPRTLDVDLLLYDSCVIDSPQLVVPHPRLHLRRFVLVPLAEIAPEIVHPVLGRSVASLLAELDDPGRVEPWTE